MRFKRLLRSMSVIGIGLFAAPFASCQLDQSFFDGFLASLSEFGGNVQLELNVENDGGGHDEQASGDAEDHDEHE